MINFESYSKGGQPNNIQFLTSLVLIILWFVYGLIMGRKQKKDFVAIILLFWGCGALLFSLGYFSHSILIIFLPAVITTGPLYGLKSILDMPSDIVLVLVSILITVVIGFVGYFIGRFFSRNNTI